MSSESQLWSTVKRNLSPFGRLVRIESGLTEPGIPDVIYCIRKHTGWLELKEIDAWPVRPTTAINIPHLQTEQVIFMESWCKDTGEAYGLFQIGCDYLLLNHDLVRRIHDRQATRAEVIMGATVFGRNQLPTNAIVATLSGLQNSGQGQDERQKALNTPSIRNRKNTVWTP